MELNKMKLNSSIDIEINEEKLHQKYDFQSSDRRANLIVGIDGGSTQTRVMIFGKDDLDYETQYVIPSGHVTLTDSRELKPKSEKLYDQLDSFIKNLSGSNQIIKTARLVRTTKLKDTGISASAITSSIQKINDPVFYLNIIDSIGYAICQKYNSRIPKEVDIVAGIALPPDDMITTKNIEVFKNNILGHYSWVHTDTGVEILIRIVDVELMTEPEAFVKAYYLVSDSQVPETVVCINTGGRSTGISVLQDSKTVDAGSKTFAYGGNQFLEEVGKTYVQNNGGRGPSRDLLRRAIKTGELKSGNKTVPIVNEITKVCKIFADRIFQDTLREVCDQIQLPLDAINEIIVCGGLAREGEYKVSMADYLGQLVAEKSPYTEYTIVTKNLIPFGLAFSTYEANLDFLEL